MMDVALKYRVKFQLVKGLVAEARHDPTKSQQQKQHAEIMATK